jgi:plasmid stability protein
MPKMIQLRNVPDDLHRKLTARAALAGMSLSDYLLTEIARSAERPTLQELQARLHQRRPITPNEPIVDALRAERQVRCCAWPPP